MKIIICKPKNKYLTNPLSNQHILYEEFFYFYDFLEAILKRNKLKYEMYNVTFSGIVTKPGVLCISHHTYENPKNTWTIKRGYVPGYLYFDKKGYSGWSEGVERYNSKARYTEEQIEKALNIGLYYIENNISKGFQSTKTSTAKKPYVLVLGQRPNDTVSKLAYIPTQILFDTVKEAFKGVGTNVHYKEHPGNLNYDKDSSESLHDLIKNSEAVYTVNSGAGFEALFHGKKVYTAGNCDYSPVTIPIKSLEDIKSTMDMPGPSLEEIGHFLHYAFNDHFVNAFDEKAIERKLFRAMNEFE